MYFILYNSSFKDFSLKRICIELRRISVRLALQVQFPILLSDFDQNDKGSTAVRRYYIPNLMAVRSTTLDHYMRTDRQKCRSILTATPVGM